MSVDEENLKEIFGKSKLQSKPRKIRVYRSLYSALKKYSERPGLENLNANEIAVVVEGIRDHALAKSPKGIGAAMVREITMSLCDDPFGRCASAARKILLEHNMHESAAKVTAALNRHRRIKSKI